MMLGKLIILAMLNIVAMVTYILYVYHTRCVHSGNYDNCALVGKIFFQCLLDKNVDLKFSISINFLCCPSMCLDFQSSVL